MPVHIALVRGINVGGRKMIGMSPLRDMLESLGFTHVESLMQSGNLVFHNNRPTSGAALERLLEAETEKRLQITVDYIVRNQREWNSVITANPFPEAARQDPSHLLVTFLKRAPKEQAVRALRDAIKGPETIHAAGKHLYIVYPAGIGKSKLTGALIEKTLESSGTARNWNTVLKLAQRIR